MYQTADQKTVPENIVRITYKHASFLKSLLCTAKTDWIALYFVLLSFRLGENNEKKSTKRKKDWAASFQRSYIKGKSHFHLFPHWHKKINVQAQHKKAH